MFNVILIGNKARQGKDSLAVSYKKQFPDTEILHFADAVKEEVMNKPRKYPLIYKEDDYFYLLDRVTDTPIYQPFKSSEFPMLIDIFNTRNITEYWGMDGNGHDEHKDGRMLQFWGTDFRRQHISDKYWVNIIMDTILNIKNDGLINNVLIPDTRFLNEYELIYGFPHTGMNVVYVRVDRYNDDGTRFLATDRDNFHISEVELDKVHPDFLFTNITNKFEVIDEYAKYLHTAMTGLSLNA